MGDGCAMLEKSRERKIEETVVIEQTRTAINSCQDKPRKFKYKTRQDKAR
jgi:hypothetical protein